jgi:hypothetical protein
MTDSERNRRVAAVIPLSDVSCSELVLEKVLPERTGYHKIQAIDPHDGKFWDVRVSLERVRHITSRSRGQAMELAHIVPEVLLQPTAIFQGVRDEGEKDWLAYCGLPSHSFDRHGDRRLLREDSFYFIFINADRVVYNFRWDMGRSGNSRFPANWEDRFLKKVL